MENFVVSEATLAKLKFVDELQQECPKHNINLFHCGSWAITAMKGEFFKDLNDIDFVVKSEDNKIKVIEILLKKGFKFISQKPHGPVEYAKAEIDLEFGSTEDPRNTYYKAALKDKYFGYIEDVKLFIADPEIILKSRYEMIKLGYKPLDETQKYIISVVESYIKEKTS